ncbi:MAG: hypothetical protein ACUVXI_14530 [bacterium]
MDIEERKRMAVEMILDDERLAAGLPEEESRLLIDWACGRAEALAASTFSDEGLREGIGRIKRVVFRLGDLLSEDPAPAGSALLRRVLEIVDLASGPLPTSSGEINI